nr:MAG TPA: hypothetical protein [Caudoviricetes sp.]
MRYGLTYINNKTVIGIFSRRCFAAYSNATFMRNVGVSYSENLRSPFCENTKRNELLWHTIPQRYLESTLLMLLEDYS